MSHITIQKKMTNHTKAVKNALHQQFKIFDYLKQQYECDDICLCFWNAPHDIAVINVYEIEYTFLFVDLLHLARRESEETNFSLDTLYKKKFGKDISNKHSSMGDTTALIELLTALNIESTCKYKPHVKRSFLKC
jgi:hypothetical protein